MATATPKFVRFEKTQDVVLVVGRGKNILKLANGRICHLRNEDITWSYCNPRDQQGQGDANKMQLFAWLLTMTALGSSVSPTYDVMYRVIVIAKTEMNARKLAQKQGMDEVMDVNTWRKTVSFWTNPKYTNCTKESPWVPCNGTYTEYVLAPSYSSG